MRKFYLENKKGDRIPLNNEDGIFLMDPTGLGVEFTSEYGESGEGGDGFFYLNKFKTMQLSPEFSLVFDPTKVEPYKKYKELLDWFAVAEELFFLYSPVDHNFPEDSNTPAEIYYRKVNIQRIDKGELDHYGALTVTVYLYPVTPWYLPTPTALSVWVDPDTVMAYNFVYDSDLIYGRGGTARYSMVEAVGHIPAAVKITFKGQITNPNIRIHGIRTGTIYGECAVTETFRETDTFILSTVEQDSYVKKIDGNGDEKDLIDSLDITKNAFFRVPITEPCEIQLYGENINGTSECLVYQYYRGV